MSTEFFDRLHQLERELSQAGTVGDKWVSIRPLLDDPDLKREFWQLLESPDWIPFLAEQGEFRNPPSIVQDGKYLQFPRWNASKYLVRMCHAAPEEVAKTLAQIRSDNPSVNADLVDAANTLPVDQAVLLVDAISHGAKSNAIWMHFKDASKFCERLANEKRFDPCEALAIALFRPRSASEEQRIRGPRDYWYREGLEPVAAKLVVGRPLATIAKLSNWLADWIEIDREGKLGDDNNDYSYIWRPAIEEHSQNSDYQLHAFVVRVLRDSCETAIRNSEELLQDVLGILEQQQFIVFKRIRIHLINTFAESNRELAKSTMLDHKLFLDPMVKHEYSQLIENRFGLLASDESSQWLAFLDNAPEHIRDSEDDEERRRNRMDYWRFHRLHWVSKFLTGDLLDEYQRHLDKFEDTDLSGFLSYNRGVRYGYESPMSLEDLEGKDFEEVLTIVCSWNANSESTLGPGVRGLADTFGQYVTKNIKGNAAYAKLLVGCPPAFVGAFLREMTNGLAEGDAHSFLPCLDLCQWLIEADPASNSAYDAYGEQRSAAVDFIERLLRLARDKNFQFDDGTRRQIWRSISVACRSEPVSWVLGDNEPEDPRDHGFTLQAINSSRGKAVEAAFAYANWIKASNENADGAHTTFESLGLEGFRDLIEREVEGSDRNWLGLAIIGSHISTLYHVDENWLRRKASVIFNLKEIDTDPDHAFGWAAWNAFLTWSHPHKAFLDLFHAQYTDACQRVRGVQRTEQRMDSPLRSLSHHVATYYGRGHDSLDGNDSLVATFLESVEPWLRGEMIDFIGSTFRSECDLPSDILERFRRLWNYYWEQYGKRDADSRPSERLFANWFAYGGFDEEWLLSQLSSVVKHSPKFVPDRELVERMSKMVPEHLSAVLPLLDLFIFDDHDYWRLAEWDQFAKHIVAVALDQGDDKSKSLAESIIDRLGRKGLLGYGALLKRDHI